LEPSLGLNIKIGEIKTNPLSFEITLQDVEITETDRTPYLKLNHLYINLTPSSLINGLIEIDSIVIEQPFFNAVINKQGELNLLKPFMSFIGEQTEQTQDKSEPIAWKINILKIEEGDILFTQQGSGESYHSDSKKLDVVFYNLNSSNKGTFNLDTNYDEVSPVNLEGDLQISPFNFNAVFKIDKLDLKRLNKYPHKKLPFQINKGFLSGKINFKIKLKQQKLVFKIEQSQLALSHLKLSNKQHDLIELSKFLIDEINIDGTKKTISIGKCSLHKPNINIIKNTDGTINVVELADNSSTEVDNSNIKKNNASQDWQISLSGCNVSSGNVYFTDNSVQPIVNDTFSDITLNLGKISNTANTQTHFTADMGVAKNGHLKLEGVAKLLETEFSLDLDMRDRSMLGLQSYLNNYTDLKMLNGLADTSLHIEYNPQAKPSLFVKGDILVKKFNSEHAITSESLVSWEELRFSDMELTLEPSGLTIPSIDIKHANMRIAINNKKQLNLLTILKIPENTKNIDTKEVELFPVSIKAINFENNQVRFSDDSLFLPFITHISKIGGSIKPLSINNKVSIPSDIALKGQINEYGEASFNGSLNIDNPLDYADLILDMKNISLNNLSPYAATFAGYQLDSGKLDVHINYKVKDKKLESQDSVVIHNIKLGEIVDKEKASSLPLEMAIALIEDNDGIIDLDIPIHGDLSDPEFEYGHVVGQAIANLLTKIITAPFTLLTKLVGGKHDLEYINFEAGQYQLTPPQKELLISLAKALKQRDTIQLEIPLCSLKDKDNMAIKDELLEKSVLESKKSKLDYYTEQYLKQYGHKASADLLKKYTKVYHEVSNKLDMAAYIKALETKLLESIKVPPSAEENLAKNRYQSIYDFLFEKEKIDKSRIYQGKPMQGVWDKETIQCKFGLK
jgi:hypothetical protein